MKLRELLSPTGTCADIHSLRIAGRFAYQMCTEAIAFSQNVPQRLLLVDQLRLLPKVIHDLLKKPEIRSIIHQALGRGDKSDNDEIGLAVARARRQEFKALKDKIFKANEEVVQGLVKRTAEILNELAKAAHAEAKGLGAKPDTDSLDVLKEKASNLPIHWLEVLDILLPHIEQKIWLTDIGAPLPAHAITRMHDQWSLFILFWCWTERQRFESIFSNSESMQNDIPIALSGAFFTDYFGIAVVDGWSDVACRDGKGGHQVAVVLGPMFFINRHSKKVSASQPPHFIMARYFQIYLRLASELSVDWSQVDDATPSTEELMDAYQARFDLDCSEFEIRARSVKLAWQLLRDVEIADDLQLSRNDWEACAVLAVWVARWRSTLKETLEYKARECYILALPDWERNIEFQANYSNDSMILSQNKSETSRFVGDALNTAKTKFPHLDMPGVTWNRFRERQAASWSAQISAVNNLMHRMSTRVDEAKTRQKNNWSAPDFLMGFGGRLCRYIAAISHAHGVVLYWSDYAQMPARLLVLESYAKPYEHRAKRHDIHKFFVEKITHLMRHFCRSFIVFAKLVG